MVLVVGPLVAVAAPSVVDALRQLFVLAREEKGLVRPRPVVLAGQGCS